MVGPLPHFVDEQLHGLRVILQLVYEILHTVLRFLHYLLLDGVANQSWKLQFAPIARVLGSALVALVLLEQLGYRTCHC